MNRDKGLVSTTGMAGYGLELTTDKPTAIGVDRLEIIGLYFFINKGAVWRLTDGYRIIGV